MSKKFQTYADNAMFWNDVHAILPSNNTKNYLEIHVELLRTNRSMKFKLIYFFSYILFCNLFRTYNFNWKDGRFVSKLERKSAWKSVTIYKIYELQKEVTESTLLTRKVVIQISGYRITCYKYYHPTEYILENPTYKLLKLKKRNLTLKTLQSRSERVEKHLGRKKPRNVGIIGKQ